MPRMIRWLNLMLCLTLSFGAIAHAQADKELTPHWTPTGWGGGGFYYAAVFDPFEDGTLYLGSDVLGCYRSTDHGKTWKIINNGIAGYGVFALAADSVTPGIIYAATTNGLSKSMDRGDHWTTLPKTGSKELRLTGEKNRSFRSIAVHPKDSNIVFAASPAGKLYKSVDGGMNWAIAYQSTPQQQDANTLRTQFGKVNGSTFGGIWFPVKTDANLDAANIQSIGLKLSGNQVLPEKCYLTVQLSSGERYNSKDFADLLKSGKTEHIQLKPAEFKIDGYWASQHKEKAAIASLTPALANVSRIDLVCTGKLQTASVIQLSSLFMIKGDNTELPLIQFKSDTKGMAYGNASTGKPKQGSYYTVAFASHKPDRILVATADEGIVMSQDGGKTWQSADAPKTAVSGCFAGSDSNTIYASFSRDGIYKSEDAGHSWSNITPADAEGVAFVEITADPTNEQNVFVVGSANWHGVLFTSSNGGKDWTKISRITPDVKANPTLPAESAGGSVGLSNPKNITVNPKNPQELYIAANWRPCMSYDGGKTWQESSRGADISCVTDIRFDKNGRVFATAMDEGTLYSEDDGASWHAMYPPKYSDKVSGHHWRIAVNDMGKSQRILVTCSPWWDKYPNRVLRSDDGGKTFDIITEGLPKFVPTTNTMWGRAYARALSVDPNNPDIIYLGMDGDPTSGNKGGGIFKSTDGGKTWNQLPSQLKYRRMFNGLAVDPTDSNRIFVGIGGNGAGIYRSEDAGQSWKRVHSPDGWAFNLHVTQDGTVYSPGANLFRSTDHGNTFKKITNFKSGEVIVGIETHPKDLDTIWISCVTWDQASDGGVYKTTDSGKSWTNITGDLPYRKPLNLRFNPHTNELWAAYVGIYKIKQ